MIPYQGPHKSLVRLVLPYLYYTISCDNCRGRGCFGYGFSSTPSRRIGYHKVIQILAVWAYLLSPRVSEPYRLLLYDSLCIIFSIRKWIKEAVGTMLCFPVYINSPGSMTHVQCAGAFSSNRLQLMTQDLRGLSSFLALAGLYRLSSGN